MNGMRKLICRHRKSATALAVIFAVQILAMTFCGTENAHAANTAMLSHGDMHMPCPMKMHASKKADHSHCAHCHPSAFHPAADHVDHVATIWMPLAIVSPVTGGQTAFVGRDHPRDTASVRGPPRSSSLIYDITQRIRV